VRALEKRVDSVAAASAQIAAQKEQQLKLLPELKQYEQQQESALQELVAEKASLVLAKAKAEAQRLAAVASRTPSLPSLDARPDRTRTIDGQAYVDSHPLPNLPPPSSIAAAASTKSSPLTASGKDLDSQDVGGHQSGLEAVYASGATVAELTL